MRRIFTSVAMLSVSADGLRVDALLDGVSFDDVQAATDTPLCLAEDCARSAVRQGHQDPVALVPGQGHRQA